MRRLKQTLSNLRKNFLFLSVVQFYEVEKKRRLRLTPICMANLRRFLKHEILFAEKDSITARKRFSMSRFGGLWTGDFMHGPHVVTDSSKKKQKKAILMAIIDDHSRMIVSGVFGFQENTRFLEHSCKEAILTHGLPDRLYVDNGLSFSSKYLKRVCAHLKVDLVHSKPYGAPSRGKIEQFFRTVREQSLVTVHLGAEITLEDFNTQFQR